MWSIVKGTKSISPTFKAFQSNPPAGDPLDLTPFTEIEVCFEKDDGTEFTAKLSTGEIAVLGNPVLGKLVLTLTAAQTIGLLVKSFETIEFQFKIGLGDPEPMRIAGAYEVVASKC